jgi:integrase
LKRISQRYKVLHRYSYEEHDQCLREGHVEAVYIALPNNMHSEYATPTAKWYARAFSEDGTLDTPKSGHARTVDTSKALWEALETHERIRLEEKLKYSWLQLPEWLFVTKTGTPLDPANVRRAMLRVLKAAKLPEHFTPHCLRHTYASILLADGVSPVYVQEQLGHATIELTVSTYGRWLKKLAPGALDRMDYSDEGKW